MLHAFGGGARVGSRRSPDCVESKSFRLPHVRATRISRTNDPRETTGIYTIRRSRKAHKELNAANSRKGVARRRQSPYGAPLPAASIEAWRARRRADREPDLAELAPRLEPV